MRTLFASLLLLASACGEDEPPTYAHAEPDEAALQTCVVCHSCGTDGTREETAPQPGKKHATCVDCHASDPPEHNCDLTCDWQKDCDQTPPYANCSQCHASGAPKKTITQINDACRSCHKRKS